MATIGEIRNNLSRKDFGEWLQLVNKDDGSFKFALIKYQDTSVIITSEQWYKCMKDNTVISGSIAIKYDEKMTYKLHPETGQRYKDESGNWVLQSKGSQGWSMIGAHSYEQIRDEKLMEGKIDALEIQKEIIVETEVVALAALKRKTAMLSVMSQETHDRIKNQMALMDDEDEEEDQEEPVVTGAPVASEGGQQASGITAEVTVDNNGNLTPPAGTK